MTKSKPKMKIAKRGRNKSPEGIAKVTQNLKPQTAHSYYYFQKHPNRIAVSCDLCPFKVDCEHANNEKGECTPVMNYQLDIAKKLFSLPYIKPQDAFLVHRFAHVQARLMVIDKWLNDIAGNFKIEDDSIAIQPITQARSRDERTLIKLADKLCLSPEARSRVGLNIAQTYTLAQALNELNDEKV